MLEASIALFARRQLARQSNTILWMTWLLVAFQQRAFPSLRNLQAYLIPTGNVPMDFPSFPGKTARHCIPSLKFVGLPASKIWVIIGYGVKRPGDLHLWPLRSPCRKLPKTPVHRLPGSVPCSMQPHLWLYEPLVHGHVPEEANSNLLSTHLLHKASKNEKRARRDILPMSVTRPVPWAPDFFPTIHPAIDLCTDMSS